MSSSLLTRLLCQRQFQIQQIRCLSKQQQQKVSAPKKYVLQFMRAYEGFLERKFPAFYRKYVEFKFCVKRFAFEYKEYRRISNSISQGTKLESLSRNELILYRQMPRDCSRALPVMIVAVMPLGIYFLPLLYFIPKRFLPSQFSNQEQKIVTAQYYHKKRLQSYTNILRYMRKDARLIQNSMDNQRMRSVLDQIQNKNTPSASELTDMKHLFETGAPFDIKKLGGNYRTNLLHSMGFQGYFSPIETQGQIILNMDRATRREGTSKMTDFDIIEACFQRGINPMSLSRTQRVEYLNKWMDVTKNVNKQSISLLLHSCTLLGAAHPANMVVKTTK